MIDKLKTVFLILLAAVLFPYMMTTVFGESRLPKLRIDNGRYVILRDGTQIPAEAYLAGILGQVIDPMTEDEALKAQAVLVRTALYREMGESNVIKESQLSVKAMKLSQLKAAWESQGVLCWQRLYRAIEATMGECIFYENQLAVPFYHEISAGSTRTDTLGGYPYLLERECFYDAEAGEYQTVKLYTRAEFTARINGISSERQIPEIDAQAVQLETDNAGYVLTAQLAGLQFSGEELQTALETASSWIRLEDYQEGIRVICRGKGHGYGLSQWGARQYAKQGKDYRWILAWYFQGISVAQNV